jgi:hypothetical protein
MEIRIGLVGHLFPALLPKCEANYLDSVPEATRCRYHLIADEPLLTAHRFLASILLLHHLANLREVAVAAHETARRTRYRTV